MKKILSLMLGIAAMFASCSQTEELLTENNSAKEVTFSLTADNGVQTRAAGTLRYVMAIYDASATNVVVPTTVFSSSSFAVRLDPGQYTCLFWADYGSGNYDASDLKSVVLQDAATEVEAFYAKQGITVTDGGTVNVTLSRAVAKVTLNETDRLIAGSIKVTYDGFKGFNVSSGIGTNSATLTNTLTIGSVITGSVASPTEVGSFLMLTNSAERILSDFKVQYESEAEKTISNVPVQANYVTNINGKFSVNVNQLFSISIDDAWNTTEYNHGLTTIGDAMYLTSSRIGWGSTWLPLTPCYGSTEDYWMIIYLHEGEEFIFSPQTDINYSFGSQATINTFCPANITVNGPKLVSGTNGWYLLHVKNGSTLTLNIFFPDIYVIGTTAGTWDIDSNYKFQIPDTENGEFVSPTLVADGELRMFVHVDGFDWWKTEFILINNTIVYRGRGEDQQRLNAGAGEKVHLNFSNHTGSLQ